MALAFNGTNKEITVTGVTSVTAQELYSEWKDWIQLSDNAKYEQAFRTFGGDPTAAGQFAPAYFFLTNGWRVVMNGLVIAVDGNLYTEEGTTPFVNNLSSITHSTSDAATVATGGSSLTAQDVWEYTTRELTSASSSGLTAEEQAQLEKAAKALSTSKFLALK